MSARVIIEVRHARGVTRIERDTTRWGDALPEEIVTAVQSAAAEIVRIFTPTDPKETEHG